MVSMVRAKIAPNSFPVVGYCLDQVWGSFCKSFWESKLAQNLIQKWGKESAPAPWGDLELAAFHLGFGSAGLELRVMLQTD